MLLLRTLLALAAALLAAPPAQAQQPYPNKEIRILVGAAAGGVTDIIARAFANYAGSKTGARFVIENNGAASGNVAFAQLARSAPDGYTLGLAAAGNIVINPHLFKTMRFDPVTALTPVAAIAHAPQVIVVNANAPYRSLAELIDAAKARPSTLTYASAGIGTTNHLAAARLGRMAGAELVHVPYRGVAPAVTDLLGGNIAFMSVAIGPVIGGIQAGQLRPLALAASARSPDLPNVPTAAEAGLRDFDLTTWFGLMAPAGTPKPVIDHLNGLVQAMLADPAERKRLADNFLVPMGDDPDAFAARIRSESLTWRSTIADLAIVMN